MRTTKKPYTIEILNGRGEIVAIEHRRTTARAASVLAKYARTMPARTRRNATVRFIARVGCVAKTTTFNLPENAALANSMI